MERVQRRTSTILEAAFLLFLMFAVISRGGKGLEATWILGGCAVALTACRLWVDRRQGTWDVAPEVWIALMLFLLWSTLSFLFSTTRNYGLDEILRDASGILLVLWVAWRARQADGQRFTNTIFTTVAVSTAVAVLIGIAVYVLQPVSRFVGTFFDWRFATDYWPNAWAEYVVLVWPIVAFQMRRFPLVVRSALLGALFGALLLSYSRGAFLAFCLQLALWALLFMIRHPRSWRTVLRAGVRRFLMAVTVTAVVAAAMFTGVNAVRSHFHEVESVTRKATFTADEGASSISEREAFWKESFQLSLERPVFGWGPYSFRFIQPRLQADVFSTSDHPHNIFLKLAMERGWPAALLLLFALLWILFPALASSIGSSSKTIESAATVPLVIALVGLLAHNLIDYNIQFVGIAVLFWVVLGFLAARHGPDNMHKKIIHIFELIIGLILIIVLVIEGYFLIISSFGRREEAAGNAVQALAWYERATPEIFSRDMHLSRASLSLGQGDTEAASSALRDYAAVNDEDPRVWILSGETASLAGDQNAALQDFTVALELGKYDYLEPLSGTLQILSSGIHTEQIAADKDKFIGIFRKFGDAILQNTHFIDLSQNVETFQQVSSLLQTLYPTEKNNLETFTQQVLTHAQQERARNAGKPSGILW